MSFFVVAANEVAAREAVAAEIERIKRASPNAWDCDYDWRDWPNGSYELTVSEPGQVIMNENS
jgi:hypothetical protein